MRSEIEGKPLQIRPVREGDEARWRELWRGYCDFYRCSIPEQVTAETWRRILTPGEGHDCAVASAGERLLGFATWVMHPTTWSTAPACYLEDLFVAPEARGTGVGRALIDWLLRQARSEGCSRLYWTTEAGNATARALYDRYTPADSFVRYTLPLNG